MSHGLTIRSDSLYCPLALNLDTYSDCEIDCCHCYLRRLNHIWKSKFKSIDPDELKRKLVNGLKNTSPKSSLGNSLKQKKTIRFGNKSDPFQPAEQKYRASEAVLKILIELKWSFVLQTQCTERMMDYAILLKKAKDFVVVQPTISPGAEKDWEILERKRTTPIWLRFNHIGMLKNRGINVAVYGEPFIPGFHTVKDFEDILKRLKSAGIKNYNTYNLHFNDFVAKRLLSIGLDIEAIWEGNQEGNWRSIQIKLIELAKKYGIKLGCPDFINSGDYRQETNTCCGIDVPNPCTFNTHNWKRRLQNGKRKDDILLDSWDGIGDFKEGGKILFGTSDKFFTMNDVIGKKKGFLK